jgi:DNA repair exonuclease SbcCD nuclease subunit
MRILVIGDIHGKISQFNVFRDFLSWSAKLARDQKVDCVVNLGDTFHNHAVLRSEIMTEFRYHVESIGCDYIYVVGNHDCYKPDDMKYHALQGLSGVKNLIIADEHMAWNGMSFVPYTHNRDHFPKKLQSIAFCHQSFVGSNYGSIVADPNHISTVNADEVDCQLIYSGHIHLRQEFGKVRYPGSPFSWSASDVDQVKGIVVFDTETLEEEFFRSPCPMWHKITLFTDDQPLEKLAQKLFNKNQDHFVIEIFGTKASIHSLLDSKQYKKIIEGHSVSVKSVFTNSDKQIEKITATSVDVIVSEYVNKVYRGSVDKNELLSAAVQLINAN